MDQVLITGGLGSVGYHVTRRFLQESMPVRLLELDAPAVRKRLRSLPGQPDVVWGDVTNRPHVDRALEGVDAVVHMAAVIPPRADAEPELARRVNVEGTRTVVEAVQAAGRRVPLVFTSSVAVFGDTRGQEPPLHPDRHPMDPQTAYDK